MREIRMLRSTRRGLETWHGRDAVTLADRKSETTGNTNFDLNRRASPRPYVRPAKAGMFSRGQSCRGKSQRPRSLDSRVAGNQDPEAYRQGLPWGDYESPGRNDSERKCGLESEEIRRSSPQP